MGRDILLAFLAMAGLLPVLCWLYGKLLGSVNTPPCWGVILSEGAGEGLEHRVRALVWLDSLGLWSGTVVIADLGLDDKGKALARQLTARWPQVLLWPEELIPAYMKKSV